MGEYCGSNDYKFALRAGSCAKLKVKYVTYGDILADWE